MVRTEVNLLMSAVLLGICAQPAAPREGPAGRESMSGLVNSRIESGSREQRPVGGVVICFESRSEKALRRIEKALAEAAIAFEAVEVRGGATEGAAAIRSALERLAPRCGANAHRLAVIAEGRAADQAVRAVSSDSRVRAFVLMTAILSAEAQETLSLWKENPVLALVSAEDKPSLRDLRDAYLMSGHADSDIRVLENAGAGIAMIESRSSGGATDDPLEVAIAGFIRRSLTAVGSAREVSFMSEDGWKVHGSLSLPDTAGRAPGVVLLHSGRSDRHIFANLERLLVRAGFGVLNIDWRGRGKTTNRGSYFEISKEERGKGGLDAKAAIDFLASQPQIESDRIGAVGVIHGAEYAVRGSAGDPRVRALVLLTGYIPADEKERAYITSGKVHVMYVTCEGHRRVTEVMRGLYRETPGKLTRLIVYRGGAIGYQLFELDRKLEPGIVEWLKETLK